ncbi:MAG TPA: ABC transporter ATP-binding protein [Mycobacteriales bacterium]|nr:ABC transporter ATP-binding protein [Mycobacteriales bacterium]
MTDPMSSTVDTAALDHPDRPAGNAMLAVSGLCKTYSGEKQRRRRAAGLSAVAAVDEVSFEVAPGELFTLLGPSGCGKTTTLRSVAGLERPDGGTISVGGRVLYDAGRRVNVPANRRRLGMVFQSYAIWPHLSVFANVAFPLQVLPRRERPGKQGIEQRVGRVLEATELGHLADRPATKLSGGQQQRLALARALVVEPKLVLLDEPLSNLDAKLRESMRFELKRLQRELGLTAVYVTHDQSEALAMSSRIAVMQAGRIVQVGKPRDVYEHPNCAFVADFIGITNFIAGTVAAIDGDRCRVQTVDGDLWVAGGPPVAVGATVTLSIRPEAISLRTSPAGGSAGGAGTGSAGGTAPNRLRGTVVNRAFLGDSVDHVVAIGKTELRNRSNPAQSIAPGTEVTVLVDPDKVALVPE